MKHNLFLQFFFVAIHLLFATTICISQTNPAKMPSSNLDIFQSRDRIENSPCDQIIVLAAEKITFSEIEKTMICGDPKTPEWNSVPFNEASYFLRNFLRDRGYHNPEITIEKKRLVVKAGSKTFVKKIFIQNSPIKINISRFWEIDGKPLTTEALNTLDAWVAKEMSRGGYPCYAGEIRADPDSGFVTVRIIEARERRIADIVTENVPNVFEGSLRRYDAFQIGDVYDSAKIEITSNRIQQTGIVEANTLVTHCNLDDQTVTLNHRIVEGKPRLVSVGFGFDTEEYAIFRASWRNSRIGVNASSINLSTSISYRAQEARSSFSWYYLPFPSRHYLKSIFLARREFERRSGNALWIVILELVVL